MRDRIPQGQEETVYKDLAQVIAPLERTSARRLLDEFKMYPDLPVSEIRSRALATVQRDVTLPAETARRLDEFTNETGQRDWSDAIARLVDEAQAPEQEPDLAASTETETSETTHETPSAEVQTQPELPVVTPPTQDPLPQQQDELHPPIQRPEFPEEPVAKQLKNKAVWNLERIRADFYTVGLLWSRH